MYVLHNIEYVIINIEVSSMHGSCGSFFQYFQFCQKLSDLYATARDISYFLRPHEHATSMQHASCICKGNIDPFLLFVTFVSIVAYLLLVFLPPPPPASKVLVNLIYVGSFL